MVGRKRHVAVDTDGRLLMVNLTPADVSDSAGAQTILTAIRRRWPWLKHLFADAEYDRTKLMDKAAFLDFVVEIVRRSDPKDGFKILPRRWVVERTFGWMIRWRRLVRDYERRLDVSEAMINSPWAPSSSAGSLVADFSNGYFEVQNAEKFALPTDQIPGSTPLYAEVEHLMMEAFRSRLGAWPYGTRVKSARMTPSLN